MIKGMSRLAVIVLTVGLLVAISAERGFAIWRVALDEHFDKDPRVAALRWPWNAPVPQNPAIRWHWNPQPPHLRTERTYTDYTWGYQDAIFNTRIRQEEEFRGSIWCAYTNRGNVDNPRWPRDSDYMDNQNAWTWWGPLDLTTAASGGFSFWLLMDLTYGCRDSLNVVVTDNVRAMVPQNPAAVKVAPFYYGFYREANGTGHLTTFPHDFQDWQRREFFLDSLRLLNAQGQIVDTVNFCQRDTSNEDSTWRVPGASALYIAFVWLSNERVITGKGAFVDDVMAVLDDGLFELGPAGAQFGYQIDEENIDWNYTQPRTNEQVYFRLNWTAQGNGEVGPFTVRCLLDDTEIFTEDRTVIAGIDTVYSTVTTELWNAVAGRHVIRWEVDTPVDSGGRIHESIENNNFLENVFEIEWNPAPMFTIHTPASDSIEARVDLRPQIFYTVTDSNETDIEFPIFLYWTRDTTGLAENPDLVYDTTYYHYIGHDYNAPRGDSSFVWNLPLDYNNLVIDTSEVVMVVGFASDNYPGNQTIAVAPGTFWTRPAPVDPHNSISPDRPSSPLTYALNQVYPNPFNKSAMIEYTLPTAGMVDLAVYDLSGRKLTSLVNGSVEAGRHLTNWSPNGIGAGVYLIRLETAGQTFMQKAIYAP